MKALLVKDDGLIYAAEVPEEPNQPEHPWDASAWNEYHKYHAFLRVAHESAIFCADQEKGWKVIKQHHKIDNALQLFLPAIYPIPDLKWEIQWVNKKGGMSGKAEAYAVAILKESTPSTEQHSIRCASYTSEGLQKRGHVPGECDCHLSKAEQEPDPLDKFMDEEIAYLKSCNPVDKWGRMENSFAAGMLHAYERIKAEREYISHRKQQNHENI